MPNSNKEFRLTKIIATLGPASEALETIVQLIETGASVFRINFSHGNFEEYDRLLNTIRRASKQTSLPIAVLGDLSGPKIRVGEVVPNGIFLENDRLVQFTKQPVVAGELNDR